MLHQAIAPTLFLIVVRLGSKYESFGTFGLHCGALLLEGGASDLRLSARFHDLPNDQQEVLFPKSLLQAIGA